MIKLFSIVSLLLLTGCVSLPTGPSVMVLPGSGQNFDKFRRDDTVCREYAYRQIGGKLPADAAIDSGVATAAVGTAVGAAAGAAIGGGGGAAIGAGAGLVAGSALGSENTYASYYGTQNAFDVAYIQCMYASGHQVPVSGQFSDVIPKRSPAPAAANIPPPPPGIPPSPPSK